MNTLLTLIAFAIGGGMTAVGIIKLIHYSFLKARCKKAVSGKVIDSAEKKSLLLWPASSRWYPIFEYETKESGTEIRASSYPTQNKDQVPQDKEFEVLYDESKPSRFLVPAWDNALPKMAAAQFLIGVIIVAITYFV